MSFTELLTASDTELIKLFYKIQSNPNDDFIIRINNIAAQIDLNHTQLICALGFNNNIQSLTEIHSILGFRSYKILAYRSEELFSNDVYFQLAIDNILDLYSARLEDEKFLKTINKLLSTRLANIENTITEKQDTGDIMSYRMEVHALYDLGIANKEFADARIKQNIGKHRINSSELKAIIDANFYPPSNLFFMDAISPEEKKILIEEMGIEREMIINRLQNNHITEAERNMLEDFI